MEEITAVVPETRNATLYLGHKDSKEGITNWVGQPLRFWALVKRLDSSSGLLAYHLIPMQRSIDGGYCLLNRNWRVEYEGEDK